MTLRQRALKFIYPFFVRFRQRTKGAQQVQNTGGSKPVVSFYSLSVVLNNGEELPFAKLKGKKVLLVNTASDCGYTPQYAELQKLYGHAKEDVEIIAFPANDFKAQEKGSDEAIERFCSANYGIRFPLAKKTVVVKTAAQHPVYQWLTNKNQNGWNDKAPSWNFTKYLVDEEGVLTHCFEPQTSPLSEVVIKAVTQTR